MICLTDSVDAHSCLTIAQGREQLKFCDSFTRLPTLIDIAFLMEPPEWLTLLGEEWSSCDNVSQYADELWDTPFGYLADEPLEQRNYMMTDQQIVALEALPEVVTVFRGCYENNKRGFCWTLDQAIAEKFPTQLRYRQDGQPLLIRATIRRDLILALLHNRNEAEVIAIRPKIQSIRYLRVTKDRGV